MMLATQPRYNRGVRYGPLDRRFGFANRTRLSRRSEPLGSLVRVSFPQAGNDNHSKEKNWKAGKRPQKGSYAPAKDRISAANIPHQNDEGESAIQNPGSRRQAGLDEPTQIPVPMRGIVIGQKTKCQQREEQSNE